MKTNLCALLWRIINRAFPQRHGTMLDEALEWWREEVMMEKIFFGWKRFLKPSWWMKKILIPTFPKEEDAP